MKYSVNTQSNTSSCDAKNTAPSSCSANNDITHITGIAVAMSVLFIYGYLSLIMDMGIIILNGISLIGLLIMIMGKNEKMPYVKRQKLLVCA